MEDSQMVKGNEVISVGIEKATFLKPGLGIGRRIRIRHIRGEIFTGIWLSDHDKSRLVERINFWRELKGSDIAQ